jgi:signal transduction histidine kinase
VVDISERKRAEQALQQSHAELQKINQQLKEAQNQLVQSEEMASIGQLAAGVAHEINNPIGYVNSNLSTLERYLQEVFSMLAAYESAEGALPTVLRADLQARRQAADLAFLREDIHSLVNESKEGVTRVTKIVKDLKDFSHVDASDEWKLADLHQGLDSTLNIVWNELRYKCEVKKEYGVLPEIECLPSQLNQVFMNMLVNGGHAIEERGTIVIRTGADREQVWVEFEDSGKGIAPEHIERIFDPFFTTKPVGKGTGLGLSLSYGIVQKHRGRIEVKSVVGRGTTFRVWLPVHQVAASVRAKAVAA